jgi:hypothetical protein
MMDGMDVHVRCRVCVAKTKGGEKEAQLKVNEKRHKNITVPEETTYGDA